MNHSRTITTLEGSIERITYYSPDSRFAILKVKEIQSGSLVSVLGPFAKPVVGERLRLDGRWETHPKYGQQLRVVSYETLLPSSHIEMERYLSSGIIGGIGATLAARLVARFGEETFDIMEKNPERLVEVDGIGPEKAFRIAETWQSRQSVRLLTKRLQENGVKPDYAAKLFRVYGEEALQILETDPYRLFRDIPKFGFQIADTFASGAGIGVTSSKRARACLLHLLLQASEAGHLYVPEHLVVETGCRQFGLDEHLVHGAIADLVEGQEVIAEENGPGGVQSRGLYLKESHQAESGVFKKLTALLSLPTSPPVIDTRRAAKEIQIRLSIKLSKEQLGILEGILSHRVAVITGGPGTGKTTLLRSMAALFDALGKKIALAAPTGRAARRLAEVTGKTSATLHKLLKYNPTTGQFEKNQDDPLDAQAILVDEASMIDIFLMDRLLKAMPLSARLILVGDLFQLPSVGPGTVLSDLIQSQKIKTFTLSKIFRQAQKSRIILNAHNVRKGNASLLADLTTAPPSSDFVFIEENRPDSVLDGILDLYCREIPRRFGFDPVRDVQVLSPMHKGPVGTINLNACLQRAVNPQTEAIHAYGNHFRCGDKVIHLKNNYQKDIFNGDIGIILSIDDSQANLVVDYDGRQVSYEFSELDELALAYAISVHKSQGSEYPAVIIPLTTQHFSLLQRNLLYTAITRGKKLVMIIGSQRAVKIALDNDTPRLRRSGLAHRLAAAF